LLSPQQQKDGLEAASKQQDLPTEVKDIFVVPDYSAWLKPHKRPVARYCKERWTQLQWHFTKTDVVEKHFPLGVRTQYKKYSSDCVFEIREKSTVNLRPGVLTHIPYVPVKVESPLSKGTHILRTFPTGTVPPMPYTSERKKRKRDGKEIESRTLTPHAALVNTYSRVKQYFKAQPDVISQWDAFRRVFPDSNDVNRYVNERGLHRPLNSLLMGSFPDELKLLRGEKVDRLGPDGNPVINGSVLFDEATMLVAEAQESVVVGSRPKDASEGLQPLRLQPHPLLQGQDFLEGAPSSGTENPRRAQATRQPTDSREEDLNSLNNNELKALIKSLNGKGYSRLNKQALVDLVITLRGREDANAAARAPIVAALAAAGEAIEQSSDGSESSSDEGDDRNDTGGISMVSEAVVPGGHASIEEDSDNDEDGDGAFYDEGGGTAVDDDTPDTSTVGSSTVTNIYNPNRESNDDVLGAPSDGNELIIEDYEDLNDAGDDDDEDGEESDEDGGAEDGDEDEEESDEDGGADDDDEDRGESDDDGGADDDEDGEESDEENDSV
jgi:hypothetical protein